MSIWALATLFLPGATSATRQERWSIVDASKAVNSMFLCFKCLKFFTFMFEIRIKRDLCIFKTTQEILRALTDTQIILWFYFNSEDFIRRKTSHFFYPWEKHFQENTSAYSKWEIGGTFPKWNLFILHGHVLALICLPLPLMRAEPQSNDRNHGMQGGCIVDWYWGLLWLGGIPL